MDRQYSILCRVQSSEGMEDTINWRMDLFAYPFKQQANEGIFNTLYLNFGSQIKM